MSAAEKPPIAPFGTLAEQSYEDALARVELIIRRLDGGAAGLRETLDLVREGRTLIEFCARELEAVGHALEELRLDELVERLAAGPTATPPQAPDQPSAARSPDAADRLDPPRQP